MKNTRVIGRPEQALEAAALALGRSHGFEEAHARQVTARALELFDLLRPLHCLDDRARLVLLAAGLLHDIGIPESFAGHHKRALAIIRAAALPGLTSRERLMAANVGRYHRKREPKRKHAAFAALDKASQATVKKLAALLRVADVLDREHRNLVRHITVRQRGDVVTLVLDAVPGYLPDPAAWARKTDMFNSVFNRRITVRPQE